MTPVTDPELLRILNSPETPSQGQVPQGLAPVTDPELLAKLNDPNYQDIPSDPNLFQRIGSNLGNRYDEVNQTLDDRIAGNISDPTAAIQVVGKGVGGSASDILGETTKSSLGLLDTLTPEGTSGGTIKKYGGKALSALIDNPIVNYGASQIQPGYESSLQAYGKIPAQDRKTVESVGNLANLAAMFTPVKGHSVASIAGDVAAPIAKTAIAPAVGIGKGLKTIGTGIKARSPEELKSTVEAMKRASSETYRSAKDAGVIFKPETRTKIVQTLNDTLSGDGILNKGLHGNTMSVLEDLKDAAQYGDFSLENLDQWRQLLGDVAGNFSNKSDARKAKLLIRSLDNTVESLGTNDLLKGSKEAIDALGKARSQWAKAQRFDTVSKVLRKSDGDAYKIKSGLSRLADNEKKIGGFNSSELQALSEASKSTLGEKSLKGLGRFGIEPGNVYLPLVAGGLGSLAGGGPLATGLVGAGTIARQANKYLARGKAERLLRTLEKR